MKLKNKVRHRWAWADTIAIFSITAFLIIVAVFYRTSDYSDRDAETDLTAGWVSDSGETYSLDKLPKGDLTLSHDVSGLDITNRALCFRTTDTHIKLYSDGELLYSYAPEIPDILGDSYGKFVHTIPLRPDTKIITLEIHPIFNDHEGSLSRVRIQTAGDYIAGVILSGLLEFCICLFMVVFGVIMLLMGILTRKSNEPTLNFFALGTFAILCAVWSVNDTYILQILTRAPAMVKISSILSLIFIAYLPVSFTASATNNPRTILLPILMMLVTADFFLMFFLTGTGRSDIHYLIPVAQAIIVIALFMTIYLIIRAVVKKTADPAFTRTVIIGIGAAAVGVVIDLLKYRLDLNNYLGASAFTRMGVLVFICVVGFYLIRERNRLAIEHNRAELMEKMAYTDGLTELANRSAFHKKEKNIRSTGTPCMIVQLDINNLKTVNDVYGHAEGDKHIIAAADTIKSAFGDIGECFRTGGDEFVVIAPNAQADAIEAAIGKMSQISLAYNETEKPPVPLRIAYGYAEYIPPEDTLDAAEQLADKNMYAMKKQMKAQNAPA